MLNPALEVEFDLILQAEHADPFHVLGAHLAECPAAGSSANIRA